MSQPCLPGRLNAGSDRENGLQRQSEISVIRSDAFEVRLRTKPVRLLNNTTCAMWKPTGTKHCSAWMPAWT